MLFDIHNFVILRSRSGACLCLPLHVGGPNLLQLHSVDLVGPQPGQPLVQHKVRYSRTIITLEFTLFLLKNDDYKY